MSEYDPSDDLPNYDQYKDYPKNYIPFNVLVRWLDCYPFYIADNVDPYIETWDDFLGSVIENGELTTYSLQFTLENVLNHKFYDKEKNFPDEIVDVIPSGPESLPGEFISKREFFELAYNYGISSKDKCEEIMQRTLSQYEFMLELFKSNTIENSDISKALKEYSQTSKATQTKQANILKDWQEAFRYMVEIRDLILKEGPAKRTERELWKMFEVKGYKISQSQMKYFKTLLPEGYADKVGGAPKQ